MEVSMSHSARLSNRLLRNPEYIVVFKGTATKEQIDNYANEVNNNGRYPRTSRHEFFDSQFFVLWSVGGKVTHRYDTILDVSATDSAALVPE